MHLPDQPLAANTILQIPLAVNALHAKGVIAYPTEAVWGMGCDPFCEVAVEQLLELKQRDWHKGVILVAANIQQCEPYLLGLDEKTMQTLHASWPGPNTWLVPNNGAAPDWITGGRVTLALRVTAHPVVAALCKQFGGAIVSTSANPAGSPPARSLADVCRYFGNQLDAIVPGELGGLQNPTQIRNVISGEIWRMA